MYVATSLLAVTDFDPRGSGYQLLQSYNGTFHIKYIYTYKSLRHGVIEYFVLFRDPLLSLTFS